jgi:hypothetical protein
LHGRILVLEGFGMWLASVLTNSLMSKLSILVEDIYMCVYIYIKKLLYLYLEQLVSLRGEHFQNCYKKLLTVS